jgi:hypothetical protein
MSAYLFNALDNVAQKGKIIWPETDKSNYQTTAKYLSNNSKVIIKQQQLSNYSKVIKQQQSNYQTTEKVIIK